MFTIDNAETTWQRIDRCSVSKSCNKWASLQNLIASTSKYRIIQIAFKFIIQKKIKRPSFLKMSVTDVTDISDSLHPCILRNHRRFGDRIGLLFYWKLERELEIPSPKVSPEEVLLPFPTVLSHLKPLHISAPCSSRINCAIILCSTLNSFHSILLHIYIYTRLLRIYHKSNAWYKSITPHCNRINGNNTYYVKSICV